MFPVHIGVLSWRGVALQSGGGACGSSTSVMCDLGFDRDCPALGSQKGRPQSRCGAQPTSRLYDRKQTPRRALHVSFQRRITHL